MKLFCTFCLSSAIVLVAACGRPKTAPVETLPDVFPGVMEVEGVLNQDVLPVRDLWRQEDVAHLKDKWDRWETEVAPHGVALVKVYPGYTLEAERPYRF